MNEKGKPLCARIKTVSLREWCAVFVYLATMLRFKQFAITQDKCAMKVTTDGVLLGAWANVHGAQNILDIGTGTGLIALMMAQKNKEAIVDAIDIDGDAYRQAKGNFENSAWAYRLNAVHSSLQTYGSGKKYDVIISNPPYFVNDLKTGNTQKDIGKHSTALTYSELLNGINRMLAETGRAFLVIPAFNLKLVEDIAGNEGLFITHQTAVIAVQGKKPYLQLLRLERKICKYETDSIVIQEKAGEFMEQFRLLTKDFYLKF